jgi:hypothetical protein
MEGVSTLDMVYLQQHILGVAPLTHPAARRAADVDGSGRAGVNDLLMLRDAFISNGKSLLGADLPWEFYPADCEWLANGDPACEFQVEIDHTAPPSDPMNFIGYKLGDINGDVMHNPGNRAAYQYPIGVKYDESRQAYVFIALETADLVGMQMSLKTSISGGPRPLAGGELNVASQNCYVDTDNEMVNMSWVAATVEHISKGDILFTMDVPAFHAKKGAWGKGVYRNEVYFTDRQPVPVELRLLDAHQTESGLASISGETFESDASVFARSGGSISVAEPFFAPNPMSEAGILYFRLDQAEEVNIEVYSASNQLMISKKTAGGKGMNEFVISATELGLPGVYLYRLTVGADAYSGRIMFVD